MASGMDHSRAPSHPVLQSRSNSEPMSQTPTPNMESSGQLRDRGKRRQNDSSQDTGYSKEQYKRDAVLIQHIPRLTKEEKVLPHLQSITQQADRDMSDAVCFLMDKNTYDRYLERAQQIVA